MPAPAPNTAAIAAAAMSPPALCLGRWPTVVGGGIRIQRRNTCRSGKVGSCVAAIRAVRQDGCGLLPGTRRLRMSGEVWGSGLLVLVHGFDSCAELCVHAVRGE